MAEPKRPYDESSKNGPASERQPLHENFSDNEPVDDPAVTHHPETVQVSLIDRKTEPRQDVKKPSPFIVKEPCFQNTSENPYKETTMTDPQIIRRVPSGDLVPMGWRNLQRVILGSYISTAFCFVTGILAIRYALRAKRSHSKGLYGLVQRDSRRAVILIYTSLGLGLLILIIIIAVVASKD